MALPLIPIILAVTALGSGIVQGISNAKNAKAEANEVVNQLKEQSSERARQAKKLMQQQKTSFLKSGVYFDSGSPLAVIDETYETMNQDIKAMEKDANAKINNLMRQGKTAFYNSLLEGVVNAGMGYFMGGGAKATATLGNIGSKISNSKIGTAVQNWYNSSRGWTKGSFGNLPTSNGLPSGNTTKIV